MVNIKGFDKAEVLAALYNRAKPLGLGKLQYQPGDMSKTHAQTIINLAGEDLYFDYLIGRVMKVDLSQDELNTMLYNRDNGEDAAEKALAHLSKKGD